MTALDFIAQRESGQPSTGLKFWREKRVSGETQYDTLSIVVIEYLT
jgi:SWI/SNF-related matrix-associated actin-dependent regulator of chromatin subfamily A3